MRCWPQTWPNTACGFGGIAGQAFTTALTVVVMDDEHGAYVFHGGRLAKHVARPSQTFFNSIGAGAHLPGAAAPWAKYEKEATPDDRP